MRIICALAGAQPTVTKEDELQICLFGRTGNSQFGSVGAAIRESIHRNRLHPAPRAWDLLSIALSVICADVAVQRRGSTDGWTRQLDLEIAVGEPEFWVSHSDLLVRQLRFLTTDVWNVTFTGNGFRPDPKVPIVRPTQESVVLLSGGLDSLIGAVDLVTKHGSPSYAVSHVSRGEKRNQVRFAKTIGGGTAHLLLNHNARSPGKSERSQRARSLAFLSYGVLTASALAKYHTDGKVALYVCENGLISINPPLTSRRIGSLSTRTTHPYFVSLFQNLLDAASLRVKVETPYQLVTKGEMLQNCSDQQFLRANAHISTSCGRYLRTGYKQCGRCIPCLIRRAAFYKWGVKDKTPYRYRTLSRNDEQHARYDDIRAVAMAVDTIHAEGIARWAGSSLNTELIGSAGQYFGVVDRGLKELGAFLSSEGVL